MKMLRFLLLIMIAAVALEGVGFAGQSGPTSQLAPSQRSDKPAEQQTNDARNEIDLARPGEPDQNQKRSARQTNATKRHLGVSASKAAPRRQVRPNATSAANNLRTAATGKTTGLQQTRSKAFTAVSRQATDHRSPAVPPPAVSVNGQHFRNSRDPGARLAFSGGPLTATRGAGAIDGTHVKRKP